MKKNINTIPNIVIMLLILFAALSRLLPHQPNFTPIGAIALFGGVFLRGKYSFLLPVVALIISDYFLGFWSGMIWVYGSFIAISLIGLWIKQNYNFKRLVFGTLSGSVLFFIVTNFGVWLNGGIYPLTFDGFVSCYIAAIPFFRNGITGDIFYTTVLFGVYELVRRKYFVEVTAN